MRKGQYADFYVGICLTPPHFPAMTLRRFSEIDPVEKTAEAPEIPPMWRQDEPREFGDFGLVRFLGQRARLRHATVALAVPAQLGRGQRPEFLRRKGCQPGR